jgi:hypothetical protein
MRKDESTPGEMTQGPREDEARSRELQEGHPEIGMPQAGMPIGVVNPIGEENDSLLTPPNPEPESPEAER